MNSKIGVVASLLLMSAMFFMTTQKLKAVDTTRIFLDPPASYAAAGHTFSINVVLEGVTDLYGWEFKLFWDNSLLECITDIVYTPAGCNWEDPNNIELGPGIQQDYDPPQGRYYRGLAAMSIQEPYVIPFSGTTVLVTLAFNVKAQGSCTLELQDTKLAQSDARPIQHTAEDGYFESGSPGTRIYVDPLVSYAFPGYIFSVNVMLGDVKDVCGWEFKLFWDNSMLQCITEEIHYPPDCQWEDPNNMKIGVGTTNDYNATHGRYYRGLRPQSIAEPYPASFNGTMCLVTLTFNVTYIGERVLSLYDTKLANSEEESISHGTVDGYVKIIASTPPKASFTFSPRAPFINQIVTFNASGSTCLIGEIVKYAWDFGDGFTAAKSEPIISHVYAAQATYVVTLNVTDTVGQSEIMSKPIIISGPCGPTAKFVYSPKAPLINESVTFDASVSELGWDGTDQPNIVTYEWNFDDGTPTLIESVPAVTHVFGEGGRYNLTLKVIDARGWWNSTSYVVYIFRLTQELAAGALHACVVEPPCYYGKVLGEIFNVEIIAIDVDDVTGFGFILDYDTTLLDAIDVCLGSFLKEPTYVSEKEMDDETGRICFGAYSMPPAPASAHGNGILATVTFEVKGVGLCIFDLHGLRISTPWASQGTAQAVIPTIHNVAVVAVALSARDVYGGQIINITVAVANSGNAFENFTLTLYHNTSVITTQTVTNLEPRTEKTLNFSWDTSDVTPGADYSIRAEVTGVPKEIDIDDNIYNCGAVNIRLGDTDADGVTGIDDAVKAGLLLAIAGIIVGIVWIFIGKIKEKGRKSTPS